MTMKLTKLLAAVALSVGLVGAAAAQTYSTSTSNGLFVARINLTSGTIAPAVNLDPRKTVNIFMRGSTSLSTTLVYELADGTVLQSTAVTPTTTGISATVASPLYFDVVRVSPSAALGGANAISVTVIQ